MKSTGNKKATLNVIKQGNVDDSQAIKELLWLEITKFEAKKAKKTPTLQDKDLRPYYKDTLGKAQCFEEVFASKELQADAIWRDIPYQALAEVCAALKKDRNISLNDVGKGHWVLALENMYQALDQARLRTLKSERLHHMEPQKVKDALVKVLEKSIDVVHRSPLPGIVKKTQSITLMRNVLAVEKFIKAVNACATVALYPGAPAAASAPAAEVPQIRMADSFLGLKYSGITHYPSDDESEASVSTSVKRPLAVPRLYIPNPLQRGVSSSSDEAPLSATQAPVIVPPVQRPSVRAIHWTQANSDNPLDQLEQFLDGVEEKASQPAQPVFYAKTEEYYRALEEWRTVHYAMVAERERANTAAPVAIEKPKPHYKPGKMTAFLAKDSRTLCGTISKNAAAWLACEMAPDLKEQDQQPVVLETLLQGGKMRLSFAPSQRHYANALVARCKERHIDAGIKQDTSRGFAQGPAKVYVEFANAVAIQSFVLDTLNTHAGDARCRAAVTQTLTQPQVSFRR